MLENQFWCHDRVREIENFTIKRIQSLLAVIPMEQSNSILGRAARFSGLLACTYETVSLRRSRRKILTMKEFVYLMNANL